MKIKFNVFLHIFFFQTRDISKQTNRGKSGDEFELKASEIRGTARLA